MSEQQNKVPLESLSPQQIMQIKQQFQNDIQVLTESLNQFRFAYNKYEETKSVLKVTEDCGQDEELLIPLSNSLYISGSLDNLRDGKRYYLIDYGTGFYVERETKDASGFCDRKLKLIKEKSEKLAALINEKKIMLEKCNYTIMMLMNRQQQQAK